MDAAIDKKNKCLRFEYKAGGSDYVSVVYRFIKDKLILIEEREDKSIGDDGYRIIHKKRIHSNMQTIRDQVLSKEAYAKLEDALMPIH